MNFDPKAIRRALMVAKDIATKIDPGFAVHNLPMPPEGVPLERAKGGPIKTVEGVDRERNLAAFMRDAHREMFDSPGKPKVFYHGTSKDFSKFGSKLNFVSQSPEFVNSFLDLERHGEKEQRVLPVHVNIKNPFDFENKSHMEALKEKIPHVLKTLDDYDREKFDEGHWAMMEMPEVLEAIKQLGHDGMYISEYDPEGGDDFKNLAVFNPAQIKSAVGNVGTFDPTDPDITKAKGGEVKNVLPVGSPERSQNLKEWLGDSFLHDEGNPRTYYHGTSKDQPFTGFKVGRHGAWFTSDPKDASMYAQANDSMSSRFEGGRFVPQNTASRVMPVYLKASNPFLGEFPEKYKNVENYKKAQSEWFDELRANGYDSWIPRSQEGNLAVMLEGPHQVKSAIGNVGTFDPSSPDIAKAEGGAVDDLLPPRNLNPMGMYSAAAEAARAIPQERGTPQQMLATMKGVKPDELRWSGVQNKFANQKTVTRDELAQHFENQLPPIEESQTTKYSQYTEPGGQNYREVLLHMPPDLAAQAYGEQEIQPFKSSHWEEPNVLAHVRLKDRELPSTKKPPKPDQRVNVRQRHSDTEGFFPSTEVDAWSTKVPGLVVTRSIEPDEKGAFTVTHAGTGLAAARDLPYHKAQASAEALGKIWDGWNQDNQIVKDWSNANAVLARQTLSQVENPEAKKVLHIEELQSDWAQQGRDKGFRDNAAHSQARKNYQDLENQLREMTKAKYMKMANDLEPGQELPFKLKRNLLSQDYKDFETFVNYLEKEQRTYYRNEDGTPSKKTNYAKFDVEELPLEDDQRGIFLKNRFTGNFFNEDLLNPNDANALAIARRAHKKIQSFENRIKNDPSYSNQVFDQYVSRMPASEMAEEHGPEWVLKTAKANDEVVKTRSGASEAPYVTNTNQWTDLALKRALTEAARGNYHHLMWTPGVAQADRYQLNKFVDALKYKKFDDGYYHVSAEKNGRTIHAEKYKPEELPGVVGQEMAKKIISGEGESTKETEDGAKVIKGLDLNVGGRGMYEYYDKILPRRLMELVKEHDPSVTVQPSKTKGKTKGFPSIQITPKLRDSILRRGFKAFKRGGAVQGHLFHHHDEPKSVEVPVMDREKAIRRALMIAKADGGEVAPDQPQVTDTNIKSTANPKRIMIQAEGKGGVRGIVVPRHMWEGTDKAAGMRAINKARADVYGAENRDPLTIGQIGKVHKQTLDEHFAKPVDQQIAAEKAALERLQKARHINKGADTLDESEKLDTVRHETDEKGRTYVAYGSKGIAGHALYTSGYGPNQKQTVLNTCPGQTTGCGGGVSPDGIVDTMRGTCFAPNAESQYVNAAVRRACHAQAKHDPAMTKDWILAHTGALRNAALRADKNNQVVLFRPNIVDESDTSSRYAISNLNKQRVADDKPAIVANSYGKTNELHDPENGYHVTYSNAGPKTKLGYSVSENISRDKNRVRSTIYATDAAGRDFQNEQGNNTPPKNSYMVTDVKRGSDLNKAMEKAIKYAKYWSAGRMPNELSEGEIAEGAESHYDGKGNPTTPDKAHYGHITLNGRRYDYQKQHILHPRLVNVPERKKNKETGQMETIEHLIPTDSRFKDNEYLPKDRFMTRNGKEAGAILMTTPTTSTSNLGHQTSFTHHVNDDHIKYAEENNGEYQIDPPEQQEASMGREYIPPQEIKFRADGGAVDGEYITDDLAGFPERSFAVQMHNAHRHEEHPEAHHHHGLHQGYNVINPTVSRALQLTNRFGMVPGMIPPYGRR